MTPSDRRQLWRRRLHAYLDGLFTRDSQLLGGAFAELQVREPVCVLACRREPLVPEVTALL